MASCINLLRVLNKLTKWKHSRIMVRTFYWIFGHHLVPVALTILPYTNMSGWAIVWMVGYYGFYTILYLETSNIWFLGIFTCHVKVKVTICFWASSCAIALLVFVYLTYFCLLYVLSKFVCCVCVLYDWKFLFSVLYFGLGTLNEVWLFWVVLLKSTGSIMKSNGSIMKRSVAYEAMEKLLVWL